MRTCQLMGLVQQAHSAGHDARAGVVLRQLSRLVMFCAWHQLLVPEVLMTTHTHLLAGGPCTAAAQRRP